MDETDISKTRDFMDVKSFSRLPFIRPTPPPAKAIRLFGKEFGSNANPDDVSNSPEENINSNAHNQEYSNKDTTGGEDSTMTTVVPGRKFGCHYCCRNFSTSQALGGHQNAHKRERQLAKRAHHQSVVAYGLMIYNRLGFVPSPTAYINSWNSCAYRGSRDQRLPVNRNPFSLWRMPLLRFGYESKPDMQDHVSLDLHL